MTDDDQHARPDPARTVRLPGTDWQAAVAIGPDGEETLWLVSPDDNAPQGCACTTCAGHDHPTMPTTKRHSENAS